MSHKDKHNSKVTLDRLSAQPSLSSGVMRIVLPENVDTVVIAVASERISVGRLEPSQKWDGSHVNFAVRAVPLFGHALYKSPSCQE